MNLKLKMPERARGLSRWLVLPPALFALACALLAPAEAGRAPSSAAATARRAPQGRGRPAPEAASTVRGRVVYDETNRPVRRAPLMLVSEGGERTEYSSMTDGRGEFRVEHVRAGSYYVFVDVPGVLSPVGFVSMEDLRGAGPVMPDLGEGRAFFQLFEVDGKKDLEVTVRAYRGAAISGRVTYADGDPAVNVNVNVNLMRRDAGGRMQKFLTGANIVSLSGLRTDDRGVFRLTGLPPGEYVVGVSEPVDHGSPGAMRRGDGVTAMLEEIVGPQLLMTFHPSATSAKEAVAVKVAAGEERDDVDVRIPERALHAVSGVVRSRREGRPLSKARVTITRRDDPLSPPAAPGLYDRGESQVNLTTTDEEGRWQFKEIPDGPYTVTAIPADEYEPEAAATTNMNVSVGVGGAAGEAYAGNMNGNYRPPRRKKGHAPTRREVEVSGGDLTEVIIEAGEGGRVSGRMTYEGGERAPYAQVRLLRVPERAGAPPGPEDVRNADVEDGQFSANGLPAGRFLFQPRTYEDGAEYYLKSITWNGKDLQREPLVLGEGASVEGIQIVFARNPAALLVTAVRAGDRKPALNAVAFLVAADSPEVSAYSAHQRFCATGGDGACAIYAPPGEYHVVVLPHRFAGRSADAEVRRRVAASPRVILRAGESKEFEAVVSDK